MRKSRKEEQREPWEVVEMSAEGCSQFPMAGCGWVPLPAAGTALQSPPQLSPPLLGLLSTCCLPFNLALLPLLAPGPAMDSSGASS